GGGPDGARSGQWGGFADLLAASSPPPARTDDGANTPQSVAAAGNGTVPASPAAAGTATSGPRGGKDSGGRKDINDQTGDDSGAVASSAAIDVTVVAGLPVPPLAFAPLLITDQTPATSQGAQTASVDPATPTLGRTTDATDDRKDADAPSSLVGAGLVAVLPGVPLIPVTSAPDSSPSVQTATVASSSSTKPIADSPLSAPVASALPPIPMGHKSTQPHHSRPVGRHSRIGWRR